MHFEVRAIAVVHSTRTEVLDDNWDAQSSSIVLCDDVPAESLFGLASFSHVEVVWVADQASDAPPAAWSRHPRGNTQWPVVGVFAQRNKDRPNRLLVSVATLVSVEDRTLVVRGLDAIDGTPLVDIKPVFGWNGPRGLLRTPTWSEELGQNYY